MRVDRYPFTKGMLRINGISTVCFSAVNWNGK